MSELVQLEQVIDQAEHDSWTPANLNDLPEAPPVQPELGDTHLVYPGKRHVFSGPPESAKTLAAYCVLIQVVRQGGTAILIDFEMGAYDARQRLRELGATHIEISRIAYLEPDEPASLQRIGFLVATRPDLVVIDASAGIYSLEGLDDNKRGDVEKIASLYVKLFWRNEIATILIDHVVKDGDSRGRYAIGSERKLGGADVHLGFDIVQAISRGSAGRYKIINQKDRAGYLKRGHFADLHLESDPDTHQIDWTFSEPEETIGEDGYFRPTHLMEKVSVDLETRREPVTSNAICDALGGRKQYVHKAINALTREGFIHEEGGPNRSRLLRSTQPYRENDTTANPENGSTMRPEPLVLFSRGTTNTPNNDLAQPCDNPVVPGGSPVVPGTTAAGGSQVGSPLTGEPPRTPPRTDHPESPVVPGTTGWLNTNGHLVDTELAWLDTIAPDHDPDADPNP